VSAAAKSGAIDDGAAIPQVTEQDAGADRDWFRDQPQRRFRARAGDGGVWIIRRRAQGTDAEVYLRTFSRDATSPKDDDSTIAARWYQAAYSHWSPAECQKAARKATKAP
jgi:hypothetical protein